VIRLLLADLYDRGLKDFESLSSLEKDVFVVHDLDIYYEMEGGFEDYFLSGGRGSEISWLSATLERIQDAESAGITAELRRLSETDRNAMAPLCDSYFSLKERRWDLLLKYLLTRGAEVVA
jgi:hypothetical protein